MAGFDGAGTRGHGACAVQPQTKDAIVALPPIDAVTKPLAAIFQHLPPLPGRDELIKKLGATLDEHLTNAREASSEVHAVSEPGSDQQTIPVGHRTRAAILIEFGDGDGDRRPDTTFRIYGSNPLASDSEFREVAKFGPVNAPVEEVKQVISMAIRATPAPEPVKVAADLTNQALFLALQVAL